METRRQHPYTIIHLHPDDNLLDSMKTICKNHAIKTSVILSGIGQLKDITLGYFKEKDEYPPQHFPHPHELLCLSGSLIEQRDDILAHLHAVIGSEDKQTFGGHLIDATVHITNEIIMLELPMELSRTRSEKTGLMELDVSS